MSSPSERKQRPHSSPSSAAEVEPGTLNAIEHRRPGRPRDARAEGAILEATWAEVDREGLAGLSLDKVAARAGVSKATIYRRWKSKEALVLDAWRIAIESVKKVPDTGSLRDDLAELFVEKAELFDHQPMTILLPQMVAAARQSPELMVQFREFEADQKIPLRTVLERARDRGELRSDLDVEIAITLFFGPLLVALLMEDRLLDKAELDSMTELLLSGMGPRTAPTTVAAKRSRAHN